MKVTGSFRNASEIVEGFNANHSMSFDFIIYPDCDGGIGMTREYIEDFREVLLPFMKKWLLRINYENRGKSDVEEFEKDFNEILDLAIKALEQEPTTKNDLGVDCISRKAVFEVIDDCNSDGLKGIFCSYNDGERFKEYIKNLPSVTPQPCNDAVSRKDVVKILGRIEQRVFDGEGFDYEEARAEIDDLPSVTPQEPKTGHWIFIGEENEEETMAGNFCYVCSECGFSDVHGKTTYVPYCWQCGAKMAESEEAEE